MKFKKIELKKNSTGRKKWFIEPEFSRGPYFAHSWGQCHQHFTGSFYAQISQNRQKDCQLKLLFAILGSSGVKAARKVNMLVKLTPGLNRPYFNQHEQL